MADVIIFRTEVFFDGSPSILVEWYGEDDGDVGPRGGAEIPLNVFDANWFVILDEIPNRAVISEFPGTLRDAFEEEFIPGTLGGRDIVYIEDRIYRVKARIERTVKDGLESFVERYREGGRGAYESEVTSNPVS